MTRTVPLLLATSLHPLARRWLWPWSSYHTLRAAGETKLDRASVLDGFGDAAQFETFHREMVDEAAIRALGEENLE